MRIFNLFIVCLCVGYGKSKIQYFKPCQESSPQFNSCLKKTAQSLVSLLVSGDPQLKLNGLEPFIIEDTVNKVSPTFKFSLTNCVLYGPSTTIINDLKVDSKSKKIYLEYTNSGYMEADYELNGKSSLLTVAGSGRANITIGKTLYSYDIDYETVKGKDNKNHWKIKQYQANYSPDIVIYRFDNLFNGNKELADNVHRFSDEYWKDIFTELGPPMMAKVTNRMIKEIGRFFASIPAEEMLVP